MPRIIILSFLMMLLPNIVQSKEMVLLITNNHNDYQTYKELIEIQSNSISYNIKVILVKDDFYTKNYSESISFLNNTPLDTPLYTLYLNSSNKKPMIYGFSPGHLPNRELIQYLISALKLWEKISQEFPLYMSKIIPEKEIVTIYRNEGFPIILLEGLIDPQIIIDITKKTINKNEKLYYPFYFFNNFYILNETVLLLSYGTFLSLLILIINLNNKRIKFHFRINKNHLSIIPLKIISIFLFFFIATLVIKYITELSTNPNIITKYSTSFFIIKHLILFFIYGICFQIIKDSSISKSPYFYSYTSFFFSLFTFTILSIIYLPLALYQIWAITLTLLFITSKKRSAKKFFLFCSPILILIQFITLLKTEPYIFTKLLLLSKYKGNIILTLFLTPYVFLQESYFRFTHKKHNKVIHYSDIILSLLTLTITFTLTAIILELN